MLMIALAHSMGFTATHNIGTSLYPSRLLSLLKFLQLAPFMGGSAEFSSNVIVFFQTNGAFLATENRFTGV